MTVKHISIFAGILSAGIALASCGGSKKETADSNEKPVTVELATAGGNIATGAIEASGQVEAAHSVNISTRVMGYITKMNVKAGDAVRAGQLLFTVSSNDISAKRAQTDAMIAQAEAAQHNAQKDLDRYTALYKQQSATAKELEQVTLQYQSAKASVEAAKQMRNEVSAQLAYASVTAPFSGVVTQKLADAGSMANPGMPILTLEQSGSLQVSVSVPENQVSNLKTGDDAIMNIESVGKIIHGKVIQLNPSSQFTGGQYIAKISLPASDSKGLYAGMYVHVQIPVKEVTGTDVKKDGKIFIPVKALVTKDQLTGIYTVSSQNTAMLRWLRLGNTSGDQVEVLSGLAANEPFVIASQGTLYNGAPVNIKK